MLVYVIPSYNRIFIENIDTSNLKKAIIKYFYDEKENVFRLNSNTNKFSQLGNSLCILIGIGNDDLMEKLINDKKMIKATLSMRCFLYDALLTKKKNTLHT